MVVDLLREMLLLLTLLAAPLLLAAMITGVLISLLQAVTQIQEQTLTFVPKLLAMGGVLLLLLPWYLGRTSAYLASILARLPLVVGQ
jgi:flagellar biosynthetic protein FliQ